MTHQELALTAAKARLLGLDMVYRAASGHPGGSFSAMDLLTALYHNVMRIDPRTPQDPGRDRFVLSKGHCTPALYPTLALRGYFPLEELKLFRSVSGQMSGHAEMHHVRGVDMSTGSLGQGISAAIGMAMAGKLDGQGYRVYAMLGDGELEEGQVWEAAMSAAKFQLDNLCAIVDINGLQIDGPTSQVMPSEPLDRKWAAFGWHVIPCNGHDYADIQTAYAQAQSVSGQPSVILARTVKGKGVSYMENSVGWHGKAPDAQQYHQGRQELVDQITRLARQVDRDPQRELAPILAVLSDDKEVH